MKKRYALIALLLAAPILLGAELLETGSGKKVVTWQPAGGPVDPLAIVDADGPGSPEGLTVHEWGTFTSVAGPDGSAIEWLPAGGPTDLPCFVFLAGAGPKGLPVTEQGGRANRAKIRMETPVLYFYSSREEQASVKVSFPQGLITEWFPQATLGPVNVWEAIKRFPGVTSTIEWNDVKVMPGATVTYPLDEIQSHYYAARRTDSDPLQVGKNFEKFLFYRGIAAFDPPLSTRAMPDGKVLITNTGSEVLPAVVLFENRNGKIGYRVARAVSHQPVTLESPELNQTFDSLQKDLEAILREQGMYAMEARAMVDTWKDSWFEQGTRLFYMVPSKTVDALLPLEITPNPVRVARAFVGRMEVFTPETLKEVQTAAARNDRVGLETYGRFLAPILHDFLKDHRADGQINAIRADYVNAVTGCSKKNW
jgi:hypothetical protein